MSPARALTVAGFVLCTAAVAACGGGGGGGGSTVPPAGVSTEMPIPQTSLAPESISTVVPVAVASGSPAPLIVPALPDVSAQLTLPIWYAPPGATMTVTTGTIPPTGTAVLQSTSRRSVAALGVDGIVYVTLVPSTSIVVGFPGVVFTLGTDAQIAASDEFFLAYFDGGEPSIGYQTGAAGPVSSNGDAVSFPLAANPRTLALQKLVAYVISLYRVRAGASPPPTVTPPPSAVSVSPSALSFLGTSTIQTFTAGESGYSGTFTATSGAPDIASVTTVDGHAFTVTPQGSGTTAILVSDASGNVAAVTVTVTITIVPISQLPPRLRTERPATS